MIAGYLAFILEPGPENFNLIRLRDAADGWVQDVRLSKIKNVCYIGFILFL
jgi:hypothetical protein